VTATRAWELWQYSWSMLVAIESAASGKWTGPGVVGDLRAQDGGVTWRRVRSAGIDLDSAGGEPWN
jgi:hypothetical protein